MYRVNSRVLLAGFLVAKGAYAQGHAEPVVAANIEPSPTSVPEFEPPPAPLELVDLAEPPPAPLVPPAKPIGPSERCRTAPEAAQAAPAALPKPSALAEPPPGRPKAPPAPSPRLLATRGRMLAGHRFLPTFILGQPFAVTHFTAVTQAGYEQGSAHTGDSESDAAATQYSAALVQSFALQAAILPVWALRVRAYAGVNSGLNREGLRDRGTDAAYGVSAGTTLSAPLKGRLQVGMSADFSYKQDYNLNVVGPLTSALQSANGDFSSLINNADQLASDMLHNTTRFDLALSVPWALGLHRSVGVLGEFGLAMPLRSTAPAEGERFLLGAALSLDAGAVSPLPLGLVVGYRGELPTRAADVPTQHRAEAGLYYTGRGALALGLHAEYTQRRSASMTFSDIRASIVTRYYWQ